MTETPDTRIADWIGHDLVDEASNKIGRIDDVYVDEDTGRPEWVAVTTGLFGTRLSFVPLRGLTADGDRLVSPWDKDMVKDAPNVEADGHLERDEEDALYRHYGMSDGGAEFADRGTDTRGAGHDTSGPNTDSAMTRSEEEMRVDTTEREAGRARLRKWVETEHQTVTVPVRKEYAEVVREPIKDENRDAAMDGPELSEEEHEVVLSEEEAVVNTRVVPKERVRLDKNVVVEDEQVDADLSKERIEVEGDARRR